MKTHDIDALLKLAASADTRIPQVLTDATELALYGVEYRYPGDYPEATLDDAKQAIILATLVRSEILSRLPAGVLPQGG